MIGMHELSQNTRVLAGETWGLTYQSLFDRHETAIATIAEYSPGDALHTSTTSPSIILSTRLSDTREIWSSVTVRHKPYVYFTDHQFRQSKTMLWLYTVLLEVTDITYSPWPSGRGVLHHHHFRNLPVFTEILSEALWNIKIKHLSTTQYVVHCMSRPTGWDSSFFIPNIWKGDSSVTVLTGLEAEGLDNRCSIPNRCTVSVPQSPGQV